MAPAPELARVLLAAVRHVGMEEVGQAGRDRLERAPRGVDLGLEPRDLLLEPPALGGVRLALLGRELPLARLLVLVAAAPRLVELGLERAEVLRERDRGVDVHAADPPPPAALGDLVAALAQDPRVEHGAGWYRILPMLPRAVLFDFGGTLFSYREVQGQAFRPLLGEALRRLRVTAEPRAIGRAWKTASAETWREFNPRPYYLHKDLFQDNFRRFGVALGATPTADDLEWFHDAQRKLVYEGFALRAGCVAMLGALRAAGIHAGIVSNIDDDYLEPMLERAGLRGSLDAWTSSEAARSCKPHEGDLRRTRSRRRARPPPRPSSSATRRCTTSRARAGSACARS